MQAMLTVSDLNIGFDDHAVIHDLNFEVKRDSTLAIIGPNGSGKSVLVKALINLIPYSGNIKWDNGVRIGYIPQKLSIQKDLPLTVLEFLELKETDHVKINNVLKTVGIKEKAEHIHHDVRVLKTPLGSLSGGELQRILMAFALLEEPNVLLLDEPTAGVDLEGEQTFYSLFEKLKKDKDLTIIFISHDMEVVKKYADQIIELNHDH